MRKTLRALTTKRLDGRSAVAVAVRNWKGDVRADLGADLTRAQETILEATAQAWVILSSLDDYIARQPSLVTRKRQLLPVVVQRMQVAEGLARNLERLGLDRKAKPVPDLTTYLATREKQTEKRWLMTATGRVLRLRKRISETRAEGSMGQEAGVRCDECGRPMQRRRPWQRFCSTACRLCAYWRRRLSAESPGRSRAAGHEA
jgi:hypothetical protein